MQRIPGLLIACTLLTTACATEVGGEAVSAPSSSVPSFPTGAAVSPPSPTASPLPFTPRFKARTNERNNGSSFEPCTAYTADELIAIKIDPTTLSDAAKSDSPNFRGCDWKSLNSAQNARDYLDYSNIVGKRIALDDYKREQSFRQWQPDRTVGGRRLAVGTTSYHCVAVFISQQATIISTAQALHPSPGLVRECDAAVALATLSISKAP